MNQFEFLEQPSSMGLYLTNGRIVGPMTIIHVRGRRCQCQTAMISIVPFSPETDFT